MLQLPSSRRRSGIALLAALTIAGATVVGANLAQAVPSPSGPAGNIQTMGGVTRNYQQGGYGPEDAPANESQFLGPRGLGFASNGDVFIADAFNHRIRWIDSNGVVHLLAGSGVAGAGGDGGLASGAQLNEPHGVAVDSNGNVYIADTRNCVIRKVDTARIITTFAGTGEKDPNTQRCKLSATDPLTVSDPRTIGLDQPTSLFMTRTGMTDSLWIVDTGNSMLRRIDIAAGAAQKMTRVAGSRSSSHFGGDGGEPSAAALRHPAGIWVADSGTVYFTDGGNNLVRMITPPGMITPSRITTIAGNKAAATAAASSSGDLAGDSDGDGGLAVNAHLDEPRGITGDNQGNLYIAEEHGARIRRIRLGTGRIETIAGDGTVAELRTNGGSAFIKGENGPALDTQFNHLRDIHLNPADGSLWIADSRNNRVRAISDAANAPGRNVATGGGTPPPTTPPTTTPPTPPTTGPTTTTTKPTPPATTTSTTSTTTTTAPDATGGAGTTQIVSPSTPGTVAARRSGYWMVGSDGAVYPFGDAKSYGNAPTSSAVDLEPTPSGNGYWIVDAIGRVFPFGDAGPHGNVDTSKLAAGEKVTSLSATSTGGGYWIFTSRGRVLTFGNAAHLGDVSNVTLAGPVLDSIATPSGKGYFMVASDGGIFSFGDAEFHGSMGGEKLNAPVQSLVPDSDGVGYWLVASDGGIFAFEAGFKGSLGNVRLNRPVTGMVRAGTGYLMVGEDGGIFDFSGTPDGFKGSLGSRPPAKPITSVAVLAG